MRDYVDYLASPLWLSIRRRVYARANGKCEAGQCGKKATAIHHWSYALMVMRGANIKPLQAVCDAHHKRAHHQGMSNPQTAEKRAQRRAFKALVASGGAIKQKVNTSPRLVRP